MEMDTNNPVIKLCADGMQAEAEGRIGDAHELFTQAWALSTDDYDASIAAHFLARHQKTPEETLKWNKESLYRANAVNDERISGFYPSLYLNLGYSFEVLGEIDEARHYYDLAAEHAADLPDTPYGAVVRNGIERAFQRIHAHDADL